MPVSVCVAHGCCVWSDVSKDDGALTRQSQRGSAFIFTSPPVNLSCRTFDTKTAGDDQSPGLSKQSHVVGVLLCLLMLGLSICLLGLLLHKRERR